MSGDGDESVCLAFYRANGNSVAEPTNDATTTLPPLRLFAFATQSRTNWFVLGAWAKIVAAEHMRSMSLLRQWQWTTPRGGSDANKKGGGGGGAAPTMHRINYVVVNSDLVFHDAIRDALLLKGVAATVYEKDEGGGAYRPVMQGSPGLLGDFEGLLFESSMSSSEAVCAVTACVLVRPSATAGRFHVAVGMVSPALRRLYSGEVVDSAVLAATDAVLTQWSVKELYVDGALEAAQPSVFRSLQRIVQRGSGICLRFFHKKELSSGILVPSPTATVGSSGSGALASAALAAAGGGGAGSPSAGAGAASMGVSAASSAQGALLQSMRKAVEQMLRVREDAHRLLDTPDALSALAILIAVAQLTRDATTIDGNAAVAAAAAAGDASPPPRNSGGGSGTGTRGVYSLQFVSPHTLVRLDTAAVDALQIVSRTGADKITITTTAADLGVDGAAAAANNGGAPVKQVIPGSVFGWLNRCATAAGSRMMRQWLLQPLRTRTEIYERQACVQALVDIPVLRTVLVKEVLSRLGNMDSLNRKLQRRTISLKELHSLIHFCDSVPQAIQHIKAHTSAPHLHEHRRTLHNNFVAVLEDICAAGFVRLRKLIECTIEITRETGQAIIAPHFDDGLQATRAEMLECENKMEKETRKVMKEGEWTEKTLRREATTAFGIHFRVTRKEDKYVRENPKKFTTLSTTRTEVRFTTDKMRELQDGYREAEKEYAVRQDLLQQKLIETASTYVGPIDEAKELLARLDVFCAWAHVVATSRKPMVRPKIGGSDSALNAEQMRIGMRGLAAQSSASESQTNASSRGISPAARTRSNQNAGSVGGTGGTAPDSQQLFLNEQQQQLPTLEFEELWHPLIEARRNCVTSNIYLGAAAVARENSNKSGSGTANSEQQQQQPPLGYIITGVNMGGKSSFMRAVGIAAVLAHCGCFVPAAAADISLLDGILCRVGATDYLTAGVSTFMAEMLECSAVLGAATQSSLVIVDELGRGTSTFDGFGLAWTIADHLVSRRGAMLLFATHFHEMTHIEAHTQGRLRNVHVAAETRGEELIQFLYRIQPGACDRSFGVAIAKMAGLPAAVVAEAKAKARDLEKYQQHEGGNNSNGRQQQQLAMVPTTGAGAVGLAGGFLSETARTQLLQLAQAAMAVENRQELTELVQRVRAVDVGNIAAVKREPGAVGQD